MIIFIVLSSFQNKNKKTKLLIYIYIYIYIYSIKDNYINFLISILNSLTWSWFTHIYIYIFSIKD
ncbi:hypothetical protein ACMBCM_06955, partial [Spiroplasma sp. K1]